MWQHLKRDEKSSGGYGGGETPVPIPNTAVKPSSADGTAWGTVWESRSPPGHLLSRSYRAALFFVCAGHGAQRGPGGWETGGGSHREVTSTEYSQGRRGGRGSRVKPPSARPAQGLCDARLIRSPADALRPGSGTLTWGHSLNPGGGRWVFSGPGARFAQLGAFGGGSSLAPAQRGLRDTHRQHLESEWGCALSVPLPQAGGCPRRPEHARIEKERRCGWLPGAAV